MSTTKNLDSTTNLLSKAYDCSECEPKWTAFWSKHKSFSSDPQSTAPNYSLVIPPPNVTGKLHMGHALVNTIQDILARFARMRGYEVVWVPGLDHAGIATQTVVERHLIANEGKRRSDFSREEFLKRCFDWKLDHEDKIYTQLKRMGCSCDWDKARFTLDEGCQKSVNKAFKTLYDQGLIYRGDYLVNWDPVSQTALADDEVEHEERKSHMWTLRYCCPNNPQEAIEVATTRPETIFGDCALAVHPSDQRYSHWIGKQVVTPLSGRLIDVIADGYVDPDFGTGALKITPAHDPNDYQLGLRHNLPLLSVFTPDGKLNQECGSFAGMSIQEARGKVISALKTQGLLVKEVPHTHRIGVSYRSGATIEPMLSKQWFVKVSSFKDEIKKMVSEKEVELFPEGDWDNTFFHWIDNLRDWCISRQLWWGHQIPIWYNLEDETQILCSDTLDPPEQVLQNPSKWKRDNDVLDTWFSSALWPFSALGWPEKTPLLERSFPNSVLVTGHDILFFWVARMLLMSHLLMKKAPFPKVFLHGLIYAKSYWKEKNQGIEYILGEEKKSYDLGKVPPKGVESRWEKMSKSKGNVIDPMDVMADYGADAMRLALTGSVGDSRQIDLDLRRFEEFRNFSNKLYNASRFIFMHLSQDDCSHLLSSEIDPCTLSFADLWILNALEKTEVAVREHIESFAFEKAVMQAYHFFWDQFCAYYLEISKPVLTGTNLEDKKRTQQILLIALGASLRILHPFAPFITSEIFSLLQKTLKLTVPGTKTSGPIGELAQALKVHTCSQAPWPALNIGNLISAKQISTALENMELFSALLLAVRQIRAEMKIPPQMSSALKITLIKDKQAIRAPVESFEGYLRSFIPISSFNVQDKAATTEGALDAMASVLGKLTVETQLPKELHAIEEKRLTKVIEQESTQIENLKKKLSNPSFCQRAPQELVQATKDKVLELQTQVSKLSEQLKSLRKIGN